MSGGSFEFETRHSAFGIFRASCSENEISGNIRPHPLPAPQASGQAGGPFPQERGKSLYGLEVFMFCGGSPFRGDLRRLLQLLEMKPAIHVDHFPRAEGEEVARDG